MSLTFPLDRKYFLCFTSKEPKSFEVRNDMNTIGPGFQQRPI